MLQARQQASSLPCSMASTDRVDAHTHASLLGLSARGCADQTRGWTTCRVFRRGFNAHHQVCMTWITDERFAVAFSQRGQISAPGNGSHTPHVAGEHLTTIPCCCEVFCRCLGPAVHCLLGVCGWVFTIVLGSRQPQRSPSWVNVLHHNKAN